MSDSSHDPSRLRIVVIGSLLFYALMMALLGYAWYAQQWISAPFHFFDDLPEWKQMDKLAHFFWAFQASALATRLLAWAGLDQRKSSVTGAIMGFFFVSCIEIPDGFSSAYGASVFDIAANGLGAAAFLAQIFLWKKLKLYPKFSFHPSAFAPLRPEVLGNGLLEQILKDYNGQTFWYSFQSDKLPLPRWLTLAVGVGADGMVYGRDAENLAMNFSPGRRYFLSLDLNLSHVRLSSPFAQSALHILNIIKVPAPALEISTSGIRFHPIYF